MRIADTDFVLIPDWLSHADSSSSHKTVPDDDHWISRWQRSIASARWLVSGPASPADRLASQCAALNRPTVIIAHGRGLEVLLAAAPHLTKSHATGAFIVAPARELEPVDSAGQVSAAVVPLAFPSVIVAPDDHPLMTSEAAQSLAQDLGSHYVAAGTVGRLDAQSGHGPWPDGLMRLGWFLKRLGAH